MPQTRPKRSSRKDLSPIGRRLREERTRLGLSQQAFGEAAGLEHSGAAVRINQYEQGVHTPNFTFVKQAAKVAGLDPCFFYAEADQLAELIRKFDGQS